MFGRITQKERHTIEALRRAPMWKQLTQQVFDERVARRAQLLEESAVRQKKLWIAYETFGAQISAADERLERARAELIAATDARIDVWQRADGARSQLDQERNRVRRALHEDNEPLIGHIGNLCIGLEDRLRLKVWTTVYLEKNVLGQSRPAGVTNTDEVSRVVETVRRVATEMRELAESSYPANLPELLAARHQLLREIDQKFDCQYIAEREIELEAA